MADKKISALDPAIEVTGEDLIVIVDKSENKTVKVSIEEVFSQISSDFGAIKLQGDWDASTGNPPSTANPIINGFAWRVSTSGNTNLGGITEWNIGDIAVKTSSGWLKIANSDVNAIWGNISGNIDNQTDLKNLFNTKADLVNGVVPESQLPDSVKIKSNFAIICVGTEQELVDAITLINTTPEYIAGQILFKNDIQLTTNHVLNLNAITLDLNNYTLVQNEKIISIQGGHWTIQRGALSWKNMAWDAEKTENSLGIEILGNAATINDTNTQRVYNAIFNDISFSNYIGTNINDTTPNIKYANSGNMPMGQIKFHACTFVSVTGSFNGSGEPNLTNHPFILEMDDITFVVVDVRNHRYNYKQSGNTSKAFKINATSNSDKIYFFSDGSVNFSSNTQIVIDPISEVTGGTIAKMSWGVGAFIEDHAFASENVIKTSVLLLANEGSLYKTQTKPTVELLANIAENIKIETENYIFHKVVYQTGKFEIKIKYKVAQSTNIDLSLFATDNAFVRFLNFSDICLDTGDWMAQGSWQISKFYNNSTPIVLNLGNGTGVTKGWGWSDVNWHGYNGGQYWANYQKFIDLSEGDVNFNFNNLNNTWSTIDWTEWVGKSGWRLLTITGQKMKV